MNVELRNHIENNVFPMYNNADGGHGMEHITYVIERSMRFAKEAQERGENVNLDMAYAVAAYHDTGHPVDPKNHEMVSAEIMRNDKALHKFFNDEQIEIMADAVEDHRSSKGREPRSIYGQIVSTADKNTSLDQAIMRAYNYRLKHFPEMTLEQMADDSREMLAEKFAMNGPAAKSMYFDDAEFKNMLGEIADIIKDPERFRERYYQVIEDNAPGAEIDREKAINKGAEAVYDLHNYLMNGKSIEWTVQAYMDCSGVSKEMASGYYMQDILNLFMDKSIPVQSNAKLVGARYDLQRSGLPLMLADTKIVGAAIELEADFTKGVNGIATEQGISLE